MREQEEDTVSLGDEPLDWGDSADDVCDLLANNPYGGSPPRDLYVTRSLTPGKANPFACAVIAPCISEGDIVALKKYSCNCINEINCPMCNL